MQNASANDTLDLHKISFTTNATDMVYDIYAKGHRVHCLVVPSDTLLIPGFEYGWYQRETGVYQTSISVDEYEEGSHVLQCSSPMSNVPPFSFTFFVIRKYLVIIIMIIADTTKRGNSPELKKL